MEHPLPDLSHSLDLLSATCFLYHSVEDAEAGDSSGGSGVVVAVPLSGSTSLAMRYAVSNWHVVCDGGFSVIRVTDLDGTSHVIEKDPSEWVWLPGKQDVAVTVLPLPEGTSVPSIPLGLFVDSSSVGDYFVGDDVFLAGRFLDYDGKETNKPALRFGHISMVDAKVKQPTGFSGASVIVDAHSRTGFSGGPVFIFRNGAESNPMPLFKGAISSFNGSTRFRSWGNWNQTELRLLGIHWGQFPERWQLSSADHSVMKNADFITDGAYVTGLSGMTCVVPADQILEVLMLPVLQQQRDEVAAFTASRAAGEA